MKNKAASAQTNGAAFAAFRKNFGHLLAEKKSPIVIDEFEYPLYDLFLFWELGMRTYFENLLRVGISLSAETNTRWLSQAMIIEIGDADGSRLPEESRPFIEFGKRFSNLFFPELAKEMEISPEEDWVSPILIELALEVLKAVFLREVAVFAPACSDGRSVCGTAGAQIIPLLPRRGQVH